MTLRHFHFLVTTPLFAFCCALFINFCSAVFLLPNTWPRQHVSEWSYRGANGPSRWPFLVLSEEDGVNSCGGTRQSPINIFVPCTVTASQIPQNIILFNNYDVPLASMDMENSHLTISFSNFQPEVRSISGGGLETNYLLQSFHFHWGSVSRVGSEHTINGRRFPLELHLVHYKSTFDNALSARSAPDGLAVVAVLFRISTNDNPALEPLLQYFPQAISNHDSISLSNVSNFAIGNLLPPNRQLFYRYHGSLTTPPCSEAVVWTIMAQMVPISERQMAAFRVLRDSEGQLLTDNFRPLQRLNMRSIYSTLRLPGYSAIFNTFVCDNSCLRLGDEMSKSATFHVPWLETLQITEQICDITDTTAFKRRGRLCSYTINGFGPHCVFS